MISETPATGQFDEETHLPWVCLEGTLENSVLRMNRRALRALQLQLYRNGYSKTLTGNV